jgi:hypothetical protein
MSELLFSEGWLCFGSFDISGTSKGFPYKVGQDIEEWICFPPDSAGPGAALAKRRAPSTPTADVQVDGYLDFQGNYQAVRGGIGSTGLPVTFGPLRSPGSPVELMMGVMSDYAMGDAVGKVCPLATNLHSTGLIASGLLHEFRTITGDLNGGSHAYAGGVGNDQTLVAHVHSCALPGGTTPSLGIVLQRSTIGDYTDAITVATFTVLTGTGYQRIEVPGPITDTNFRFVYDHGGTGGPAFLVRTAVGIA